LFEGRSEEAKEMAMSDESKFCEARNMAQRLEGHVVVESELLPVPLAASYLIAHVKGVRTALLLLRRVQLPIADAAGASSNCRGSHAIFVDGLTRLACAL